MSHALHRFQIILDQVFHPEFTYEALQEGQHYFLRVGGFSKDNRQPASTPPQHWHGRKWRLSVHMTDGEVVQTALMATLAAAEHEHRERFKYKGVSLFDPHFDVDQLVALRSQPASIKERADDRP